MAKPLKDRTALVTGGARGIGRATADALAAMGAAIAIVDLDIDAAHAAAAHIADEFNVPAAGDTADVADYDGSLHAHRRLSEKLGPITVLVNNAGIMPQEVKPHHTQDVNNFHRMLDIHLGGTANFCHLCLPAMHEAGFGRIVNLSSVLGLIGLPNRLGYMAAKTGMNGLTRGLAVEHARYGITVNAVAPGYIATDTNKARAEAGMMSFQAYAERTPVGRWGDPVEIARVIAFLAHPDSGFITGAVWPVDGGYTVRGDPNEDIGPMP